MPQTNYARPSLRTGDSCDFGRRACYEGEIAGGTGRGRRSRGAATKSHRIAVRDRPPSGRLPWEAHDTVIRSHGAGVSRIQPVLAGRSSFAGRRSDQPQTAAWQRVAVAACEQVAAVTSRGAQRDAGRGLRIRPSPTRWLLDQDARAFVRPARPESPLGLLVGPRRAHGAERRLAVDIGFTASGWDPTIASGQRRCSASRSAILGGHAARSTLPLEDKSPGANYVNGLRRCCSRTSTGIKGSRRHGRDAWPTAARAGVWAREQQHEAFPCPSPPHLAVSCVVIQSACRAKLKIRGGA